MDWRAKSEEMTLANINAKDISIAVGQPYEKVRRYIEYYRKKNGINRENHGRILNTETIDLNDSVEIKNDVTSISVITEGKALTPDDVMKHKNLNPLEWSVVSFTTNSWQGINKNGELVDFIQSKLVVKPADNILGIKYIEQYFNDKPLKPLEAPIETPNVVNRKETLVIDIADLHSGLLAWDKETGANYDLEIMRQRLNSCIDDILSRITPNRFKLIIIASLGDILHTDNNDGKTTKGTPQQIEGRMQKIIMYTAEGFERLISEMAKIAPVDYIYVPGNHDELTGFMFAYSLSMVFRNYSNITFSIDPNPYKARLIGKTLVGFTHGTGSKARNGDWLVNDFRELFGKCAIAEVHQGHLHTQGGKETNTGVIIHDIPKMCNASAWEHLAGYRSYACMMCFVYDDDKLHRDTWVNYC